MKSQVWHRVYSTRVVVYRHCIYENKTNKNKNVKKYYIHLYKMTGKKRNKFVFKIETAPPNLLNLFCSSLDTVKTKNINNFKSPIIPWNNPSQIEKTTHLRPYMQHTYKHLIYIHNLLIHNTILCGSQWLPVIFSPHYQYII